MVVVELPPTFRRRNPVTQTTARALFAPEVRSGPYSIREASVFSFGMIVIEVRHIALEVERRMI